MLLRRSHRWLLRTVSTASLCTALCVGAQAQSQYFFDFPQQPLSAALTQYARVSSQQIIFTEDLVLGYTGKALHGNLSATDALSQLLEGTGLFSERTVSGALMIRRADVRSRGTIRETAIEPDGDIIEQVVVTGLIQSLQNSLDIKRGAIGVVDVITAEDIGKFPDGDLAAAMQRIPGVTVSRGASSLGGITTSTGAATEITVRGFGPSFNETLYDGRKVASGVGRAFDFSAIGADFVSRVDVLKSPDATLSAGAIGATVNIRYPKPFDHSGLKLTGSVSTNFSPGEGNATPNVTALFSDTFVNDTLGILIDGAFAQNRTRGHHVDNQGWQGNYIDPCQRAGGPICGPTLTPDAQPVWYSPDYGIYQETTQESRINGRVALQWRASDNLLITLDDNYSRDTLHSLQYGYSVWFNSGALRNVTTNTNGTIISFIQPNSPTDFQSQVNGSVLQNNDTGLNVKWDINDHLQLNLDYDHSQAWLNPGGKLGSIDSDVGYGPSTPGGIYGSNIGLVLPGGHNLPYLTGYGPGGNNAALLNNGLIGSHVFPMSSPQRFDRVQQFKAEATWTKDDNFKITAGFQRIGDHDDAQNHDDFTNNQWQAYAGYGPASNNNGTHGAALPQNLFTQSFSTGDFINGFGGASNLPPKILVFNAYSVLNYLQSLGNPQTQTIPGFNVGCCTPAYDGTYRLANNIGSYSQVIENTNAGYISAFAQVNVAGMPLRINAGLRDEFTNVTTIGIASLPVSSTIQPSDHTAEVYTMGPQTPVNGKNSYQYLLPNLDLNLGVTDDLQVRFDASRTLTRPPLNLINPILNAGTGGRVGALTASGGNPNLMPYLSDNIDASAEWYYQKNSYLSVDVFSKNVTNFIVAGSTQQGINGLIDPATGAPAVFTVTTQVNGPTANVYGAEFAVQHVFDDSGFGVQANATLVGTNKPYDRNNLSISGFAVTGLANSANLVAFYDKDGFQARVAANWRDDYLDRFSQQQNISTFGTEPTFVNATTQIDFSTSYNLTDLFSVYFSAQNLNDATYSTHGRYSEQLLDAVDFGRRFTLGFRFRY